VLTAVPRAGDAEETLLLLLLLLLAAAGLWASATCECAAESASCPRFATCTTAWNDPVLRQIMLSPVQAALLRAGIGAWCLGTAATWQQLQLPHPGQLPGCIQRWAHPTWLFEEPLLRASVLQRMLYATCLNLYLAAVHLLEVKRSSGTPMLQGPVTLYHAHRPSTAALQTRYFGTIRSGSVPQVRHHKQRQKLLKNMHKVTFRACTLDASRSTAGTRGPVSAAPACTLNPQRSVYAVQSCSAWLGWL
jgi:hypothetical protein